VHLYGEAQTVEPVYPIPPHWPYSATVPVAVVVVLALVVVVVDLLVVVVVALLVVVELALVVGEELPLQVNTGGPGIV